MVKKKLVASAVLSALLSTTAQPHTNSIGYVGDGSGGLNFWYGNWHGTAFNEAEIKIEGTDANGTAFTWSDGNGGTQNYSIDAFNLLSQNSPAGLISGTNFFTSDGTQLVPYDPTGATNGGTTQESYVWQGINYTNLATGNYTFTYIPLGSAEGSYPNQTPTMDWMPMDNVILSLSITLTQGDLNGDANNNGILDINEVAAGSASGGPVVTYGTSTRSYTRTDADSLTATDNTLLQTISTYNNSSSCTQGTVTTLHDGVVQSSLTVDDSNAPTCSANDPSLASQVTGRIDQVATANDIHNAFNHSINFDRVELINNKNDYDNGTSGDLKGFVIGGEKELANGLVVNGGFSKTSGDFTNTDKTTTSGIVVGGGVKKKLESGSVAVNVNHASTDINYTRTIGTFSNAGTTKSKDTWLNVTYVGDGEKIRPILGVTKGKRTTDSYTETGSVQSARTVAETKDSYTYATVGFQAEHGPFGIEALKHSNGTSNITALYNHKVDEDKNFSVGISRGTTELGDSTSIVTGFIWRF